MLQKCRKFTMHIIIIIIIIIVFIIITMSFYNFRTESS